MTDDERKDIISRARQHVYDLADGKARWTMEIPPRAMTDSDFLLLAPGHIAEALMAERDRLRDILDCERGIRAPEGWVWTGDGWSRIDEDTRVEAITQMARDGRLSHNYEIVRGGYTQHGRYNYMLEAIEAADGWAKENA